MGYVNVKLQPEVLQRLEQEVEDGQWDSISEATRYYLVMGMERDTHLRERVEELKEDKRAWREQARSDSE
jgi:Arc/MetJ-type ribon-helix-helix transcriptional regulator